jgi:hypothetical protein
MNKFESLLLEIFAYFNETQKIAEYTKQRFISIGGNILLTYSSEALEKSLFKAFEHLEITGSYIKPAFSIFVCDSNVLNCDLPGYTWLNELSNHQEKIITYNCENVHALYNPKSGIFSLVDTSKSRGFYYIPGVEDIPFYEKAAPMRMLLHWWCEKSGFVLIHAAAVGWDSGAVLLAGRGGTGKSTTAILAAQNGLRFLGDDYVILLNSGAPSVQSAYNSIKFRWEMLERMPEAEEFSVNNQEDEKGYFYLSDKNRDSLIQKLPLKAVLLPVIAGKDKTDFCRIPQSRGLMGLAASSIFQMPGSGKQTLKNLASILKDIPVFEMSLGTDNADIVESLKKFLRERKR